jgi:DNA-binding response OmpR family regulator
MRDPEPPSPLIVLVEDEEHIAQGLLFNLQAEGYRTAHEADGADALAYLLTTTDDIGAIVLDAMLPGKDGFEIVRTLREHARYFPVLMLTARSRPEDILEGLNAGADDYLAKPFDLSLLLVRLKTLLRRAAWQIPSTSPAPAKPSQDHFDFNGRSIHFDTLELHGPGDRITHLTLMEADLLRYLTDREGRIVPRKDILEQVWRVHEDTDTRAIDNFIVRLRRYIEDDPGSPAHLLTVRGIGYRFFAQPQS